MVSFPHLALGNPRTVEGVVRRHRDEGVEAGLQLGDALQGGFGQLDGRDRSAPQQLPGGANGQAGEVYRSQCGVSSLCDDEPLERRDQGPDPPTVVLGACGDEAAGVTSEGLTGPVGAHHLFELAVYDGEVYTDRSLESNWRALAFHNRSVVN